MRELVTATAAAMAQRHRQHAFDHFLHRLKKWARAIPMMREDDLPEHRVEWFVGIDDGPVRTIDEAMKELPALWLPAVPDAVCVVPKSQLEKLVGADVASYLSGLGLAMVEDRAARLQQERIERTER